MSSVDRPLAGTPLFIKMGMQDIVTELSQQKCEAQTLVIQPSLVLHWVCVDRKSYSEKMRMSLTGEMEDLSKDSGKDQNLLYMHSKWSINTFCEEAVTNHQQSNILHHWETGIPSCYWANMHNILFPLCRLGAMSHPPFPLVDSTLVFPILLAESRVFHIPPISWTLNITVISVALAAWAVITSGSIQSTPPTVVQGASKREKAQVRYVPQQYTLCKHKILLVMAKQPVMAV